MRVILTLFFCALSLIETGNSSVIPSGRTTEARRNRPNDLGSYSWLLSRAVPQAQQIAPAGFTIPRKPLPHYMTGTQSSDAKRVDLNKVLPTLPKPLLSPLDGDKGNLAGSNKADTKAAAAPPRAGGTTNQIPLAPAAHDNQASAIFGVLGHSKGRGKDPSLRPGQNPSGKTSTQQASGSFDTEAQASRKPAAGGFFTYPINRVYNAAKSTLGSAASSAAQYMKGHKKEVICTALDCAVGILRAQPPPASYAAAPVAALSSAIDRHKFENWNDEAKQKEAAKEAAKAAKQQTGTANRPGIPNSAIAQDKGKSKVTRDVSSSFAQSWQLDRREFLAAAVRRRAIRSLLLQQSTMN